MDHLPDQTAADSDDDAVDETLDILPERDRLMLRLFYRDMMSQKQIAGRLRIPEGTVKSRMNAARNRFRPRTRIRPKEEIS